MGGGELASHLSDLTNNQLQLNLCLESTGRVVSLDQLVGWPGMERRMITIVVNWLIRYSVSYFL